MLTTYPKLPSATGPLGAPPVVPSTAEDSASRGAGTPAHTRDFAAAFAVQPGTDAMLPPPHLPGDAQSWTSPHARLTFLGGKILPPGEAEAYLVQGEAAAAYRQDTKVQAVFYHNGQIVGAVFADGKAMLGDFTLHGKKPLVQEMHGSDREEADMALWLTGELTAMLDPHFRGGLEVQTFDAGTEPVVDAFLEAWLDGTRLMPVMPPPDMQAAIDLYRTDMERLITRSSQGDALEDLASAAGDDDSAAEEDVATGPTDPADPAATAQTAPAA